MMKGMETYNMSPRQTTAMEFRAIDHSQKVMVEFHSSKGEVSVYLLKNFPEDVVVIPREDQILGWESGSSGRFTAGVDASTRIRITIRDADEDTKVTPMVTNVRW